MTKCHNCYREIETPGHIICPDCGAELKPQAPKERTLKARSRYVGESKKAKVVDFPTAEVPTTPEAEAPTMTELEQVHAFYLNEAQHLAELKNRMPVINGCFASIRKWNSNNTLVTGSLEILAQYINDLIDVAKTYGQMIGLAIEETTPEANDGNES